MKNVFRNSTSPVRRITIDERLTDGLIRILIANLKNGVTSFSDNPEYWEDENELLVQPDDYQENMEISEVDLKEWPWEKLFEGQVFLQGKFRDIKTQLPEGEFVVDMEVENFQNVERLSKNRVKRLYMNTLERSISNGENNQA